MTPETSGFSRAAALERCFGSEEVLVMMMRSLLDEGPLLLQKVNEAWKEGRLQDLAESSHRLKNTVVYLNGEKAVSALRELERALTAGRRRRIDTLVPIIDTEVQRLIAEVKEAVT